MSVIKTRDEILAEADVEAFRILLEEADRIGPFDINAARALANTLLEDTLGDDLYAKGSPRLARKMLRRAAQMQRDRENA